MATYERRRRERRAGVRVQAKRILKKQAEKAPEKETDKPSKPIGKARA